ncbi:MAG: peroxiredoxin, partial [Acinetobacter amyesii]
MSAITLPDQSFPTTSGEINLTEMPTEWLIVYFYPKDSTP